MHSPDSSVYSFGPFFCLFHLFFFLSPPPRHLIASSLAFTSQICLFFLSLHAAQFFLYCCLNVFVCSAIQLVQNMHHGYP